MSFQNCFIKLKKFVEDKEELKGLVPMNRLEYLARQLENVAADSMTPSEFSQKAQDFIDGQLKRDNMARKAANAMTLQIREQALRDMVSRKELWETNPKFGDPVKMGYEGFRTWQQGGSLRPGVGGNVSVAGLETVTKTALWESWRQELGGLEKTAPTGQLDHESLLALDAIDRHTPLTNFSEQAIQYAKSLKVLRDRVFSMEQARNPYLMKAQDYLWAQLHDQERIQAMGKDAWTDLAMKTFGDKSYPELTTSAEKRLKFGEAYDKIVAGIHGSTLPDVEAGPGNILRRQAASRQWRANSAQAFADYNAQAGPSSIYDGMSKIINRTSRDIALLQKAGPSPDVTRDQLYARYRKTLTPEQDRFLDAHKTQLDAQWESIKGTQTTAAQSWHGSAAKTAMTVQYMARAGAAVMHAAPGDLAAGASLLNDLSQSGIVGHAGDLASQYARAMAPAGNPRGGLRAAGLWSKSWSQELMSDYGAPDAKPGAMAKAALAMGSWSGYNRHIDAMQSAIGTVLGHMTGQAAGLSHAELPVSWQQGLARYGIGEHEWNAIRTTAGTLDGDPHLSAPNVNLMSKETAEAYLRNIDAFKGASSITDTMWNRVKDELYTKMALMVNEHATLGTAHQDTRQRQFFWQDSDINKWSGTLAHMLLQFKGATNTMMDVYRRNYYSGTDIGGNYSGVFSHFAMATFLTAMSKAMYDMAAGGKTPENPVATPEKVVQTLLESGVAGGYGNILSNELNRGSDTDSIAHAGMSAFLGPSISSGVDLSAAAITRYKEARGESRGRPEGTRKLTQWALSNAPIGVNSFVYTKQAFDYLIGNQFRELAGHGFLRSIENATHKTPALLGGNQKYLLKTPTGAPGLLMGGEK